MTAEVQKREAELTAAVQQREAELDLEAKRSLGVRIDAHMTRLENRVVTLEQQHQECLKHHSDCVEKHSDYEHKIGMLSGRVVELENMLRKTDHMHRGKKETGDRDEKRVGG